MAGVVADERSSRGVGYLGYLHVVVIGRLRWLLQDEQYQCLIDNIFVVLTHPTSYLSYDDSLRTAILC